MPTESRTLVANALHMVFGQGSRIPDTWDANLSHEDAVFAQALLGHCLRRWGRLQTYVQSKLANPDRGLPLGSQVCLAMGLVQLAWLPGISTHACVNESVDLIGDRTHGFPPHRGLANALLRAAAKDRLGLAQQLDALPPALDRTPFANRVLTEALAPRNQQDRIEELWERLQRPPRPAFTVVKNEPLPEGLEADPELPGCYLLRPDAPFPRQWLASGAGMVQDRSSQALMSFKWDRPVRRIADLCAAPGGKTTSLGLRWPEAELYAVEQHPRRARRLEENLLARGIRANIVVQDASAWLRESHLQFDLILLDAPCSGSGTLCKHPELVWLGDSLDMKKLLTTQKRLFDSAHHRLNKNGLFIYSVCSWLPIECLQPNLNQITQDEGMNQVQIWQNKTYTERVNFNQDPLTWEGEGFQAFALTR